MPSAFFGLEVAKRGLFTQQAALHTTGHNIANANTEGFSRQRVNMEASDPFPYPSAVSDVSPGQMGTGVTVQSLQRLREGFLDLQFRGENKNVGYYETKTDTMEKVEVILNEPSDQGLQHVMDEFWNSFQKLSLYPTDRATRETARQNAMTVADNFSFIQSELRKMKSNLDSSIKVKAEDMNSIIKQVSEINRRVADVVPHGYVPNDLYDQRDVLLDKLSKMGDIEVKPVLDPTMGKDTGMVNVFMKVKPVNPDGTTAGETSVQLVNEKTSASVTVGPDALDPSMYQVNIDGASMRFTSGEMAGLMESRGVPVQSGTSNQVFTRGIIPDYMERINTMANTMVKELNTLHKEGYNLNDLANYKANPTGFTPSEIPFFVSKKDPAQAPADATDIQVNPLIMKDWRNIAVASKANPGDASEPMPGEGDNRNALRVFALKENTDLPFVYNDGTTEKASLDGFTRSIISKLGIETRESQRMKDTSSSLAGEVENRRQSVSGVSLDEEMSNMIKFQHAYSAAARTITAVDEMLDKIINGMGLVGR